MALFLLGIFLGSVGSIVGLGIWGFLHDDEDW